ncbi:hypothetical protein K2173_025220 [Erythroxylum novogranatense]|uniref:Uncharacterized protein n=1 Tax=Erythroxylum novogranatense TaxID=1862640 RepID=A0AAV8UH91_9ROSI|nr:hypothetical protein K2173_025220 [Erythroxylum novogranatense]
MAAAEARAVWQRAANRCFVQEDAKRAPKLACCQSSSSLSKQVEGAPTSAADVLDDHAAGFMPLNRNPSCPNLLPDTRWWLQLQPCNVYDKGLTYEQLSSLEAEMENWRAGIVKSPSKFSEVCSHDIEDNNYTESFVKVDGKISTDSMVKDIEAKQQVEKASYDQDSLQFLDFKKTKDNSKMIEIDNGCPKYKRSNDCCFDPESPWIADEKNLPWWRTTDKDDLATLVAQKSLDFIENCDLPPPQKMHVKRYSCACPGSSDHFELLASSLDWKTQVGCISSEIIHLKGCPSSESIRTWTEGNSRSGSDKSLSHAATQKETTGSGQSSENDPCKAQLLEALRHSQTRAREAEKIAKQACTEKDHVIKLFFRQASQLFAYKQWFQLLQDTDQPMSSLLPLALSKGRKLRKNWQKSAKSKRSKRNCGTDANTYAVAFALGLGLVGAGLLLGWTIGWMLPF